MKATAALMPTSNSTTPKADTCITRQTLGAFTNRDAPVDQKQPDTVREVPDRGRDADHVDDKYRHHAKLTRDNVERLVRPCGDGNRIQPGNHAKAEVEHVKQ